MEVNDIHIQLETMLKQKSRNQWVVERESNSSFFHNSIKIRRSSNTISELVNENGVTISKCNQIKDLAVNYFMNKFNGDVSVLDDSLFEVEHERISVEESIRMDQVPSFEEIHEAVFSLGADSAPGPDGFADLGYSAGSVLGNLISEEQVAFMKGRNIHENISLASQMVNEIQIKRKDGNVGLKLDITQAFDTVSWKFVLVFFKRYGFSDWWCDWILNILNSSRIYVLVNSNPEGYFSIDRGLRQGDPLSPLIFVLIEDVLSRNITKLFREGAMTTMVSRKGISPTHLFFADDIMIYCKGNMKSLRSLVALLGYYQRAYGQTVSRAKSKIYYGGGSLRRRATISEFLGMPIATFPDRYLGVKVMPGAVKYHHIANVVDKIKDQLAGWKGMMLYFQDRVMLVVYDC
ncbi:uncharacterized protein LOC113345731 [Papaver somniferum]|uniref:uncharacterized protein LOC113345731 n=1 Tax=Papaver somniferum TaxID=3469 RepID=UPI000E6FFE64|nr:uncharacterized protein LOC113345731 [Papaver somniferum]